MIKRIFLLTALVCLSACQSQRGSIDYDTHIDFSQIHSYAWRLADGAAQNAANTSLLSPLLSERVQQAITGKLALVPLKQVAADQTPDVWVAYSASRVINTEPSNTRGGIGLGGGGGHVGVGISLSFPLGKPKQVQDIQITIDMIDAASQRVIWRGSDQFQLPADASPEQLTDKVNQSVVAVLDQFPPKE